MAKTSNAGLLMVVLAGMAAGLWLAARTGNGTAEAAASETELEPLSREEPAGEEASSAAVELAQPGLAGRERPRPQANDARLIPGPGETCLAVPVEAQDGTVPRGLRVALFALDEERPHFPPVTTFAAGDDGHVRACVKLDRDMDVVAFAPGWKPASRRVRATVGGRVDLEPFVLERGATVRGHVTAGGVPLARAEVEARASAPAYEARVDGGQLGWRAGGYVWCATRGESGPDGAYAISGLEPGQHKMRLCTVRQRNAAIDVQKVASLRVDVPAESADFALPAARLDLSFEASGTPLCCVEVQIEAGERQFTRRTDELGRIGFVIQPELAYQVTAGCQGFTTKRTQLRGLTNGEQRPEKIALEPQTELATLVVNDGGSALADSATFQLRPRFLPGQKTAELERTVYRDPRTRKFQIVNVPNGSWRVSVHSGNSLGANSGIPANCDQEFVVDVPDSGTVEVSTVIAQRGGVRVSARMSNGERVVPRVQFGAGEPIPTAVVTQPPAGLVPLVPTGSTPASMLAYAFSSWCAGQMDMVVSAEGARPVTVRVSIVANQLTPVDVELLPQ